MHTLARMAVLLVCGSALGCSSDDTGGGDGAGNGSGGSGIDLDGGNGTGSGSGTEGGAITQGTLEELRNLACAGWNAEPEAGPAVLQLVVDVSGSMNSDAPASSRSKWDITREALSEAIADLSATSAIGMLLYPNMATDQSTVERDVSECVDISEMIPLDVLGPADAAHRLGVLDALASTEPNRQAGTPTHDAYRYALTAFEDGAPFGGKPFMLLITDGQPTFSAGCVGTGYVGDPVDEQPIVDEIRGAYENGIKTFVIGSPGSERNDETEEDTRPWLSQAADQGGTATLNCSNSGPNYCHFDMSVEQDFTSGLRRALASIAGQIIGCNYTLPAPPADQVLNPDAVNVVYIIGGDEDNAELIGRDPNPDCTQGWRYTEDGQNIELCGETCARIQADPDARLELLFGCETETLPVR